MYEKAHMCHADLKIKLKKHQLRIFYQFSFVDVERSWIGIYVYMYICIYVYMYSQGAPPRLSFSPAPQ